MLRFEWNNINKENNDVGTYLFVKYYEIHMSIEETQNDFRRGKTIHGGEY